MEELKAMHAPFTWKDAAGIAFLIALAAAIICGALAVIPKASAQSHAAPAIAERPVPTFPGLPNRPAVTLVAHVNEVTDGDTLRISFTYSMKIRLEKCWAPELSTGDPGRKAKAELIRLAAGKDCIVNIPLRDNLGDGTTLGRFLGTVWVAGQDSDLSTLMVQGGFATRSKGN